MSTATDKSHAIWRCEGTVKMPYALPTFLPGQLTLDRGFPRDCLELEQFHYLPKRPATWCQVWTIHYHPPSINRRVCTPSQRVIAVAVLSYPVPSNRSRERYLNRTTFPRTENLTFANANLRTISRVVVHPQFRSLGLSTILVRCLCGHCDTRYVEAAAMMARAHPFFEKAGMTRIDPQDPTLPVYFILDRGESRNELTQLRYESACGLPPAASNLAPCNVPHQPLRRCA
jgi:hypothetical protein